MPGCDSSYLVRVALNTITTHDMSKEGNFALEQAAFGRFQLQSIAIKPVKDSGEALKVLIEGLREDEYVVQVNEAYVVGQTRHHQFHNACELAGSIGETKAKDVDCLLYTSDAADE